MRASPDLDNARSSARALNVTAGLLLGFGIIYLTTIWLATIDVAGHDFRFIWLAGEAWKRGIDPYSSDYFELGKNLISSGSVPSHWVYPPSWWAISLILAQLDLSTAAALWGAIQILLLVAGSAIVVRATKSWPPFQRAGVLVWVQGGGWILFCLLVALLSAFQATAYVLNVGQTSIIVYFGASVLLYGMVFDRASIRVAGLVLLFLKPQIGAVFAAGLCVHSAGSRRDVAIAAATSGLLTLPALFMNPEVFHDFVRVLSSYDSYSTNFPQTMTGIRMLIWILGDTDIGNLASAGIAIVAGATAIMYCKHCCNVSSPEINSWRTVTILTAVTITLSPLHYYDFVIIGIPLCALFLTLTPKATLPAAIGMVMLWRADDLAALAGASFLDVPWYPGSGIATVGAMCFAIAVWHTVGCAGAGRSLSRIHR